MTLKLYYNFKWTLVKSQHPYYAKMTQDQRETPYPLTYINVNNLYKCPQSSHSSDGTPLGLTPSSTTITAFGGHTILHFGTCELILSHHDHSKSCSFHVVNTGGPTKLGLPTCPDMKLITVNYGISTTQTRAVPTPYPQGNTDA